MTKASPSKHKASCSQIHSGLHTKLYTTPWNPEISDTMKSAQVVGHGKVKIGKVILTSPRLRGYIYTCRE